MSGKNLIWCITRQTQHSLPEMIEDNLHVMCAEISILCCRYYQGVKNNSLVPFMSLCRIFHPIAHMIKCTRINFRKAILILQPVRLTYWGCMRSQKSFLHRLLCSRIIAHAPVSDCIICLMFPLSWSLAGRESLRERGRLNLDTMSQQPIMEICSDRLKTSLIER